MITRHGQANDLQYNCWHTFVCHNNNHNNDYYDGSHNHQNKGSSSSSTNHNTNHWRGDCETQTQSEEWSVEQSIIIISLPTGTLNVTWGVEVAACESKPNSKHRQTDRQTGVMNKIMSSDTPV